MGVHSLDHPSLEGAPATAEPSHRRFWLADWLASTRLRWLLLVVFYVALQPPETGLGIDLCMVHRFTKAPCPGCGMTRSGANMLRGNFKRAWEFHPFGYIFMPVLFALAGLSLMPSALRNALADHVNKRERILHRLHLLVIGAFLVFGLVRFFLVLAGQLQFPAGST